MMAPVEISYFQTKDNTQRTLHQRVEVRGVDDATIEEKRTQLVFALSSEKGITLPIETLNGDQKQTHNFGFRFEGSFDHHNPILNGGYLIVSSPEGKEVGAISCIQTAGKTSKDLTAYITDKGYHAGDRDWENKGAMKIAFSLLAEVLRDFGVKKVEAYIVGGPAAEKSRVNAPRIFDEGTYASSTEEILLDSPERPGKKQKMLVTTL